MYLPELPVTDTYFLALNLGLKERVEQLKKKFAVDRIDAARANSLENVLKSDPFTTVVDELKMLWPEERERLEKSLVNFYMDVLVPIAGGFKGETLEETISLSRKNNISLRYSIKTEGICLRCMEKGDISSGYRTIKPMELYAGSYEELRRDADEILVLDSKLESAVERERVAPRCNDSKNHKKTVIPAMLISTSHRVNISRGNSAEICTAEFRLKSGIGLAYKEAELMVGKNCFGEERSSILDISATRLRSGPANTWKKTVELLMHCDPLIGGNWDELILLRRYSQKELNDTIDSSLKGTDSLRGFYKSKIENAMVTEKLPTRKKGEDKHVEIILPLNNILINHHSMENRHFSEREGSKDGLKKDDLSYKITKDEARKDNYGMLHWMALKHLVLPVFISKYAQPFMENVCDQGISRLLQPR